MSKIYIFADDPDSEAIQNAVKMLSAAGPNFTVTAERTTPAGVLSVALGILTGGGDTNPGDTSFGDEVDDTGVITTDGPEPDAIDPDVPLEPSISTDDTGGDDDATFNFESMGQVYVDGELINAFKTDGDSVLYVKSLVEGTRCSYKLNESTFGIWLQDSNAAPAARVRINNTKVLDVKVMESKTNEAYILLNTSNNTITGATAVK